MPTLQDVYEWLVDGAPGATESTEILRSLSEQLVAAGLPLDRSVAFVRTLHPHILGRAFVWSRGKAVEVLETPYATLQSPSFLGSPVALVYGTRQEVRRRLLDPSCPRDHSVVVGLAAEGFTDYVALPLAFITGEVQAVTFATKATDGFTTADIESLRHIARPLARIAEIMGLYRTSVNLLSAYVGRDAGDRILSGRIVRGDLQSIHAVIWCSDMRGFTELAGAISPVDLIGVLNELFDCQVPAIQKRWGEVLKFMGDGLLAIFPTDGALSDRIGAVCDAAFDAAVDALHALASLNGSRSQHAKPSIRFGLALHLGEIAYGNIGGAGRLDFTCIGPPVNVAARLEGLTGRLLRPVVVSEEIARHTRHRTELLGTFELKGVREPQAVFAPVDPPLASW